MKIFLKINKILKMKLQENSYQGNCNQDANNRIEGVSCRKKVSFGKTEAERSGC
jgi:hypothetical protein